MYVIGTAGHVDHGKSSLIQALTGINPDRLREEQERGLTIELGFAWLTLPSGREVSIVDVPGHVRFVRHMLAGIGAVDLALLVIAADEGVMPQTTEHLEILDLLEVKHAVVALTKIDIAEADWTDLIEEEVRELIDTTSIAGAPIVRVSSTTGAGLDELRTTIDEALSGVSEPADIGRPRLGIDRVFTMQGFGTVVTGTLLGGRLALGDTLEAVPDGPTARIRGLQTHRHDVEEAQPGTRVAVNVSGVSTEELPSWSGTSCAGADDPRADLRRTAARAESPPARAQPSRCRTHRRGRGAGPCPHPRRRRDRGRDRGLGTGRAHLAACLRDR